MHRADAINVSKERIKWRQCSVFQRPPGGAPGGQNVRMASTAYFGTSLVSHDPPVDAVPCYGGAGGCQ